MAVGFCRLEPRPWTPAPGTSEHTGLYPNSKTLHIKYINHHPLLFPSYYVNGRETSLEDFLNPNILDTLSVKISEVLEVIIGCSSTTRGDAEVSGVFRLTLLLSVSGSPPGVSREAGVAGRDQLGLRRRSRGAVGHIRCRIHVSFCSSEADRWPLSSACAAACTLLCCSLSSIRAVVPHKCCFVRNEVY